MIQIVKIGLGLAIAIIFPILVGLGVEAFYPTPKQNFEICQPLIRPVPANDPGFSPKSEEDYNRCTDQQTNILNTYNRNAFLIITLIGFLAIAVGALYFKEENGPIAPGLVFGGLFTILYGASRGFSAVDKRWLFAELLIVLIGLVFVTKRFLKSQVKQ